MVDPSNPDVVIGKSQAAAHKAVIQTAISRYALCLPLFLPSLLIYSCERLRIMPTKNPMLTAVQMTFFFGELYFAVPLAIAIYPQIGKISAKDVEPHIREWKNEHGQCIREFQFNKGL